MLDPTCFPVDHTISVDCFGEERHEKPGYLSTLSPGANFDRWFDSAFQNSGHPSHAATTPRVDVQEKADAYHLEAELPGLTEKDFTVNVEHNLLTISSQQEHSARGELLRRFPALVRPAGGHRRRPDQRHLQERPADPDGAQDRQDASPADRGEERRLNGTTPQAEGRRLNGTTPQVEGRRLNGTTPQGTRSSDTRSSGPSGALFLLAACILGAVAGIVHRPLTGSAAGRCRAGAPARHGRPLRWRRR